MFTGLVVERGRIVEDPSPSEDGGVLLTIGHSPELRERLPIGASLAVSGVCLTIIELGEGRSTVELSPETLRRSSLEAAAKGTDVNLEPALRMGDPLGGHWVQGHVDGTLRVLERVDLEGHCEMWFELPEGQQASFVEKGSVTLDGVSLTVADCHENRFSVALIPHTLEVTTLGGLRVGDRVNYEVDVLAKYIEKALAARGV